MAPPLSSDFTTLVREIIEQQRQKVDFSNCGLTDNALGYALDEFKTHKFSAARRLLLQDNPQLTSIGIGKLARYPYFADVEELNLRNVEGCGDNGLTQVTRSEGLRELRVLILTRTRITDAGVRNFAAARAHYRDLRELRLSENRITDRGVLTLARAWKYSNSFPKLRELHVQNNPLRQVSEEEEDLFRRQDAREIFRAYLKMSAAKPDSEPSNDAPVAGEADFVPYRLRIRDDTVQYVVTVQGATPDGQDDVVIMEPQLWLALKSLLKSRNQDGDTFRQDRDEFYEDVWGREPPGDQRKSKDISRVLSRLKKCFEGVNLGIAVELSMLPKGGNQLSLRVVPTETGSVLPECPED